MQELRADLKRRSGRISALSDRELTCLVHFLAGFTPEDVDKALAWIDAGGINPG